MPFRIITVPFDPGTGCFVEEELNRFCLNKRIVSSRAEFFTRHEGAYWTVFLEYEQVVESGGAADDFTEAQRLLFTRIREWRKGKAEELGVPVYVICTNAQATAVVKHAPRTLESLRSINGFGRKKIESLGGELVTLVNDFIGSAP